MIKPVYVLAYSALKPLRELAQMINKLPVQVLDTPLNFAFILRVRWMSKMSFKTFVLSLKP
jgi:hypothetical protein